MYMYYVCPSSLCDDTMLFTLIIYMYTCIVAYIIRQYRNHIYVYM